MAEPAVPPGGDDERAGTSPAPVEDAGVTDAPGLVAERVGLFGDASPMNVPNAFTFLRVLLVPVVLWLLLVGGAAAAWWAFAVFVFAAWTDSLDGAVARRYGTVTRWGQLADPIADKLLVIGTLASLAIVGTVPWWAVAVMALREVAVTVARVLLVQRRDLVVPASRWGKAKTVTQIIATSAYLAPFVPLGVADVLLWVAVAATVVSGLRYAVEIRRGTAGTAATEYLS